MKLAFCLYNYFPYGGLERDFMDISRECLKRGHTIDVFTLLWEGDKPTDMTINILPSKGLTSHRQTASFAANLPTSHDRRGYQLIMGFNRFPGMDIYYAADVCYKARVIRQGRFLARFTPRFRTFCALEKSIFEPSSPTDIIYLSGQEKNNFQDQYGTADSKFYYAPPGVNKKKIRDGLTEENRRNIRKELGVTEQNNLLLMIGSNFQTKGVDRSILALASLPQALRDKTFLVVVGKGKIARYQKMADKCGVGKLLRFMGTRDDVPRFLAGADFLLQSSISENTGNAIVEALVAGIPVLATATCGYSEHIVAAGAGKIVSCTPFRQEEMNRLLLELLESDKRQMWCKQAREYADSEDLYNRPQIVADFIEEIAAKNKQTGKGI